MRCSAIQCQVGQDFPNDTGKLEAMARAGCAEDGRWVLRVRTDDKVSVGGKCVHAGQPGNKRPLAERRNTAREVGAHASYFCRAHAPIERFGRADIIGNAVQRDLYPCGQAAHIGEALKSMAVVDFPNVNGEMAGIERRRATLRRKPIHNPPLNMQWQP